MHDRNPISGAALPADIHRRLTRHLLRRDLQEDLCFALWYPSQGRNRQTALIHDAILPEAGERHIHGNASFTSDYFVRSLCIAQERRAGLALLHSHVGPGWQGLSLDDHAAEASHAAATVSMTGLPLVGLTLGTDEAWSARFWRRIGPRLYEPEWCNAVRVAGHRLASTFHPSLAPPPRYGEELARTIGVWGSAGQALLGRLRIGIIGLGSVGSIVCDALARMGATYLCLVDFDRIKRLNRDRTLFATTEDIGRNKIDLAADHARKTATAEYLHVESCLSSVVEEEGYRAALDCDVLFSCVDRPWPRRVLNHIAYAHLIPVIDGGILVRIRGSAFVGADWHVHTSGVDRRCLECWKAFDPSLVGAERDGKLDDPSYLAQLDRDHVLLRHENVFPFSLNAASLELLQFAALVLGPVHNIGDQNYHYASGSLDRIDDSGCDSGCLYPPLTASGDTMCQPTGADIGRERLLAECS